MDRFFSFRAPSQHEFAVAGKFLFFLAVSFIALNVFVSLFPLEFFEIIFAVPTAFFLGLFGLQAQLVFGEPVKILVEGLDLPVAITYLCTGLLEWIVLCSAIAATTEVNAKKRLAGIAAGTFGIFAFNLFRINFSILAIIFLGQSVAGFSHDVFFRVFLFFSVAGFYYVWLKQAVKTK